MDISDIAKKLGLSEHKRLIRKAAELRLLCDVQFVSSIVGVGEICKVVICLEIATTRFGEVLFDRSRAIKLSRMSEKAYIRSFNSLLNRLNIKTTVDLKIDKTKLIEVSGSSESEFSSVSNSMNDLCYDLFGISKEKKDPRNVKGNRELLDVSPEKRKFDDAAIYLLMDQSFHITSGTKKWRKLLMRCGNRLLFHQTANHKPKRANQPLCSLHGGKSAPRLKMMANEPSNG